MLQGRDLTSKVEQRQQQRYLTRQLARDTGGRQFSHRQVYTTHRPPTSIPAHPPTTTTRYTGPPTNHHQLNRPTNQLPLVYRPTHQLAPGLQAHPPAINRCTDPPTSHRLVYSPPPATTRYQAHPPCHYHAHRPAHQLPPNVSAHLPPTTRYTVPHTSTTSVQAHPPVTTPQVFRPVPPIPARYTGSPTSCH